jgi:hypothetical protein
MDRTSSVSEEFRVLTYIVAWMGEKVPLDLSLFKKLEAMKKAKKEAAAQEKK